MSELTKKQAQALAIDCNITVTAGAGSGKTRILVERYLDILLNQKASVNEVLAITFTEKAAAEMLSCVAFKIEELLKNSDGKKFKLILSLRDRLSSARISTIHAFCANVLREFPLEAGLDPDFFVLNQMQSDLYIDESIAAVLEEINNDEQEWLSLFRLFDRRTVQEMLTMALAKRFEIVQVREKFKSKSAEELYAELKQQFLAHANQKFSEAELLTIKHEVAIFFAAYHTSASSNEKKKEVLNALQQFRSVSGLRDEKFWQYLLLLAVQLTTRENQPYKNVAFLGTNSVWSQREREILVNLSQQLSQFANWTVEEGSFPPDEMDLRILIELKKFYNLFDRLEAHYHQKKLEAACLDFDDLQLFVLQLLSENETVRQKLANRFRFVMVDEFQDTNRLQWEIISKLGSIKTGKFFVVGDPKQSIYGFRNADVRVFNRVKSELESAAGKNIIFEETFRFKENINEFINICFEKILTPGANPWEVDYQVMQTQRDDYAGGKIELAVLDKDRGYSSEGFLAAHIKLLLESEKYEYGDIAILMRTRTHLSEVEEQLRRSNIPFKTIGGIGFYQRQEIYDVYHLVRFLINPDDDLALVGLLRSPFAGLSDESLFFMGVTKQNTSYWQQLKKVSEIPGISYEDEQKITAFVLQAEKWLSRRDRSSFWQLLGEIFSESMFSSIMSAEPNGGQLLANLEKIIDLAFVFEQSGFASMFDFAESLKKLINTQPKEGEGQTDLEDKGTVKIMTVHQAKGLEFPVIYLPFLQQTLKNSNSGNAYFTEEGGISADVHRQHRREGINNYMLDFAIKQKQQKELAELKRLFYVACTRTRDYLVLCGDIKKNKSPKNTALQFLLHALNLDPASMTAGTCELNSTCTLKIWTEYEAAAEHENSIRKKVTENISQLKKDGEESTGKPYWLEKSSAYPTGEIFSATQLMTFQRNKEEYYKRYHLGFFESDYDRLSVGQNEEDIVLLKGRMIHRYLEKYPHIDIEQLFFENEIFDEVSQTKIRRDIFDLEEQILHDGVLQKITKTPEAMSETSVIMTLGGDFLTGTIDRIYRNNIGEWEVVDYKTNRITENQISATADKYDVQIKVYALLLCSVFPGQKKYRINLYFIKPGKKFTREFEISDLNAIRDEFSAVISQIKMLPPYIPEMV